MYVANPKSPGFLNLLLFSIPPHPPPRFPNTFEELRTWLLEILFFSFLAYISKLDLIQWSKYSPFLFYIILDFLPH